MVRVAYFESAVACLIIRLLGDFAEKHRLGMVLGEGGTLRVLPAQARTATVYTGPEQSKVIRGDELLEGGDVLPGFQVPLGEIFARAQRQPNP